MLKRVFLCVLSATLLVAGIPFAAAAAADANETDFVPVLRFLASSDTHIRDGSETNVRRIEKMLDIGYAAAAADKSYNKLDALLIAGDLTNDGTKTEFDTFWNTVSGSMRDGTQFLGVVAKNHDGYEMKRKEMRGYFTSLTGNAPDFHVVINGYHFIGLSASENDVLHYDAGQLIWLKKQLDAAVKEDPNKPVFVMHHEHVRETVYGSSLYDGWGVPYFTAILNQYPQVVDFSGHSHYPLNDPRSVWQGRFTAIGTGAIHYSEFTIDEWRAFDPADAYDTATCWVVEVDANNRIRLCGMDVNENKRLCEYVLENPANPKNRAFKPAVRKAASKPPVFADDAAISVTPVYGGCSVVSPVAQSADGMPVVLYRAYAKDRFGMTVAKSWTLPQYYRALELTEISLTLDGLSKGEYTISVVAENAYGGQSAPLQTKVTVEGKEGLEGFFQRIALQFQRIGDFIKFLFS